LRGNGLQPSRSQSFEVVVRMCSLLLDEVLGLFDRGVALVQKLVVEVLEARVSLKMVGLIVEESVELGEVRGILGLAVGLRAMVGMTMNISKVLLSVLHVLAIIDLVVLTLAISDLPSISGADVGVLAEV